KARKPQKRLMCEVALRIADGRLKRAPTSHTALVCLDEILQLISFLWTPSVIDQPFKIESPRASSTLQARQHCRISRVKGVAIHTWGPKRTRENCVCNSLASERICLLV